MILRVEIDSISAGLDLAGDPWTPELVQTFLRHLGDEVLRLALAVHQSGLIQLDEDSEDADEEPPDDETSDVDVT